MSELIVNENGMISSLEVLKEINMWREKESKKNELRHDTLLGIIRDEFEEEISLQEILESKYINRGKEYPCFNLTVNQAKQILVRESKFVRKAVIKRLEKLEKSLISKSEEEMLKEMFPFAEDSLIVMTAEGIRETKRLQLENKEHKKTIERKTNLIDAHTEDLDEVRLRKIVTDYVSAYAKRNNVFIKDVYTELYSFFGRTIKKDIDNAKSIYIKVNRELVDKNKRHNRENNLKGMDRVTPCTYHKPSTVEFITNILGKGGDLIDCMSKFFEVPVEQIIDKYKSIEIDYID